MITTLLALLATAAPTHFFTGPSSFNDVGVSNSSYPSIDKSGEFIAYQVTDTSTGYTYIHVYDTVYLTDTTVSGSLIHCARPRISRDGTAVAFFAGIYTAGDGYVVYPMIASSTSGDPTQAFTDATYTDTLWTSAWPAVAAPGISDEDDGSYVLSFGDLTSESPKYVFTATCAPSASATDPTPEYYGLGASGGATDIDSAADTIAYSYSASGSVHIYVNGVDKTTSATSNCLDPTIDAAGDKVVFDSADTSMVGSTPPLASNIFTIVLSTDTIAIPYSYTGDVYVGSCSFPEISADGDNVAFNCYSLALGFTLSYALGVEVADPTGVGLCPFNGSSDVTFYSVEEADNTKVMYGSYPSTSNDNGGGPIVAFDGGVSPRAKIIIGSSFEGVYYVQ